MIREDKIFLDRVFDSVSDPLVVYNPDFCIIRVNSAVACLFEVSSEALIGRRCYELFYGRERLCEDCHVREVFQTGEQRMRLKSITLPNGETRCFEVHAFPIKDASGTAIQVVEHSRDVTKRKDLERKLRESEERYRTVVEMAREGIYVLDAEAKFIFANQRLAEMLGYRLYEILGRSVFEFMDEEARRVAEVQLERRRNGLADVYELALLRKDGSSMFGQISVAPLTTNGAFAGSMGIITDITRLKMTLEDLKVARDFSERIINSITDNFIVIDPRTYMVVQANDSFLGRLGLESQEALLGRTCYEIMLHRTTPCEADGIECPIAETARLKRPALTEKEYPDPGGQLRTLQIAAYPFLDRDGEVELVIRLERDVTEKRKMQEMLAARSRDLQKTQAQLEVLCDFSRQVSTLSSVRELVHFLVKNVRDVFPNTEVLFLVLNARRNGFLDLHQCEAGVKKPLKRMLLQLEESGLMANLVRVISQIETTQIITPMDCGTMTPFKSVLAEGFRAWFGIPMVTQNQCVGHLFLNSETPLIPSQEDLSFCQALLEQVAGHLRHLVLYEEEIDHLRRQAGQRFVYGEIIGQSKRMQEVYHLIDLVAGTDVTVLITGENGTGKELVAQAIHRHSHRSEGPFVVANCSAYSPTLLESELFGHEKGAFTGAISQKKGRIERAEEGTLFLDEIGDIAPATQILLLRFLQDHCFERVGGERIIRADVRVLAATNRDLHRDVNSGRFRDDLYYRLNVISIHMPPLRERKEDIPLLVQHFLKKSGLKEGRETHKVSSNAMHALMDYEWPGNVRQLENALSHALILCQDDLIRRKHLPGFLREVLGESVSTSLAENERSLIARVLRESNWNKHDAARRLRVSRSTLYSKIRRYGLEKRPLV